MLLLPINICTLHGKNRSIRLRFYNGRFHVQSVFLHGKVNDIKYYDSPSWATIDRIIALARGKK